VAEEATVRRVTPDFFARHSITELRRRLLPRGQRPGPAGLDRYREQLPQLEVRHRAAGPDRRGRSRSEHQRRCGSKPVGADDHHKSPVEPFHLS